MAFLNLFKKKSSKKKLPELKAQSQNDYDKLTNNNQSISNLHIRLRLAYRAKANIEKTFIDAARSYEIYEKCKIEASLLSDSSLDDIKQPELEDSFKILQSDNGYIVSYIPMDYAKMVFDLGISYQKSKINKDQAKKRVQYVFECICKELNINKDIEILEFLDDISNSDL